jgi:hypothetical protein
MGTAVVMLFPCILFKPVFLKEFSKFEIVFVIKLSENVCCVFSSILWLFFKIKLSINLHLCASYFNQ